MSDRKKRKVTRLPSFKDHPLVRSATDYCKRVVSGKIPAGKYTRLACERQLNDLRKRDWGYTFDPDEAERVCHFIQALPHTKGKWAAQKKTIELQPWQLFIFTTIFGWYRSDGTRRFREAYVCVGRKNGKSAISAGVGLYMLAMDGEYGAEVYSGATSEKQAWEVFKPARLMCLKTPEFTESCDIDVNAKALTIAESGAKFEPVIGNPGDGASPSCAIIDEFHEHKSPELYDTMKTGMGARDMPLMLLITTAGANIGGPCHDLQRDCERMLDGVHESDELFAVIYHADEGDDWSSPATLEKANPNIGVSISRDFLIARQNEAISSPAKQNIFKIKHLNIWVSAKTAWLNMLEWNKCADESLSIDQFDGEDCIVALDLASKIDIAAKLNLFTRIENGLTHYYAFLTSYLPEDAIYADRSGKYQGWLNAGLMRSTEGNELDFSAIRTDLQNESSVQNITEIAYDPWRATQLAQEFQEDGHSVIEYRNTVQNMSAPMYELEAAIKSGRFHFDGNPVLTWMASNVVAKIDAKENIYPRKEKPENKIDGIVALIMAMGRSMVSELSPNAYEERGLRTV